MSSLHRKSLIATAAIFCCRFTGLLREITYTSLFGATGALDAFMTAFRIPNMLRDIFAEGALSQSFTGVVSKVNARENVQAAWTVVHRVVSQLTVLMCGIVTVGVLLAGLCMQVLYPERAAVDIQLRGNGAPSAPVVCVEYVGTSEDADSRPMAHFLADALPTGLTHTARIRMTALQKMQKGQQVQLTLQGNPLPGVLRVEPCSYMEMATELCRIMWPFILLASLSALSMGVLNVFGIFGLPNLASAAFNLTTIGVGLVVGWCIDPGFGPNALYGFAVATLCGGAAQLLVQLPKLYKLGYRPHWDLALTWRRGVPRFSDERVRLVWRLMLPGMIASGITQLNVFVNSSFALFLPAGAVTALSCAFHLWQLPVALFGVAIGMVVLPDVSRLTVVSGREEIARHLAEALRFMAFFAVPSTLVLGLWGEEIVSLFFQRLRFDAQASALCGSVLTAYSVGLLGYAGMKVLQPVFMALERPWAPAFLSVVTCCISISLNYLFVHKLGLGAQWLAFTTSCITTINFLFFFFYLRHLLGSMSLGTLVPGLLRIIAAGLLLAVCCFIIRINFFEGFTQWSFFARLFGLGTAALAVGFLYLVTCYILRIPELSTLRSSLLRRR